MTTSDAWLLECSDTLSIAVGDHEMVEYIDTPFRFDVPGAPEYCSAVLLWQENLVPVMDLAALLGHSRDDLKPRLSLLNYQDKAGEALQQVAIAVNRAPQKIVVDDEHACELPEEVNTSPLRALSLSSFNHNGQTVIILDISGLCSAEFRDTANPDRILQ